MTNEIDVFNVRTAQADFSLELAERNHRVKRGHSMTMSKDLKQILDSIAPKGYSELVNRIIQAYDRCKEFRILAESIVARRIPPTQPELDELGRLMKSSEAKETQIFKQESAQ